jgi:hypothetical protein
MYEASKGKSTCLFFVNFGDLGQRARRRNIVKYLYGVTNLLTG